MEASLSHELPGKTLSAEEKDMLADSNRCIKDDSSRQVQLMTIDEEDFYQLQNPSNDAQLPNAEEINITFSMRRKESEINGPSPSSLVFEKTTGYQFVSSRLTSFENLPESPLGIILIWNYQLSSPLGLT
ncbi:hypothetical protein GOBAR_DD29710 [Gossypium barbadense]|nr:hypothetical protein GOBAR_DD29710 [Gossypium barbadense]